MNSKSEENFRLGYNCCQAVVLAFSDYLCEKYQLSSEQIAAACSGFGGGMARMREVCGAFSAMVMMAGYISPATDISNPSARRDNYALVQEFAEEFKKRNGGSIICRELLGLCPSKAIEDPKPSERTAEFYKKRPCVQIISNAASIVEEKIASLRSK